MCRGRIVKGPGQKCVHPLKMCMEHRSGWGRDAEFSTRRKFLHNPNPTSNPLLGFVGSTQQNSFCLKCSQHLKSDSHQKLNLDFLLKMESTAGLNPRCLVSPARWSQEVLPSLQAVLHCVHHLHKLRHPWGKNKNKNNLEILKWISRQHKSGQQRIAAYLPS